MKALVATLVLTALSLTAQATESLTPAQSKSILGLVTKSTMVRAVIAERTKQGAHCRAQLGKFTQVTGDSYSVQADIQCSFPDGDDVGGGATILNVKANMSGDVITSMSVRLSEVG